MMFKKVAIADRLALVVNPVYANPAAYSGRALAAAGLSGAAVCGFHPRSTSALVRAVLGRKRGRLRDEDLTAAVDFVLDPDHEPLVTYLGTARKP